MLIRLKIYNCEKCLKIYYKIFIYILMRMFGILETPEGLSLDFLNNRVFYTMLLGALMFNYFYVIMFGGLTLLYNIVTGFSMSSLVIGYFLHYAIPFEPEDFRNLTSELKNRIRDDAYSVVSNLNLNWTKSLTTDTSDETDEKSEIEVSAGQIVNDDSGDSQLEESESQDNNDTDCEDAPENGSEDANSEEDKKNN